MPAIWKDVLSRTKDFKRAAALAARHADTPSSAHLDPLGHARVREELGLAYAVFAYKNFHQSSGQLGVYVGTQTASADQAVDAIRAEYDRIAREGLPADELEAGKLQLKGQIMLALESPMARMGRLAGFSLHDEPYRPLDRMLAEVDAVTADDIAMVAQEFFPSERQTVVRLGPSTPLSP